MDQKNINSILQNALEDEIPSAQIDLLPAIRSRLVTGNKLPTQQGEPMNKMFTKRLAYSFLVVAFLTVVTLLTPQGRAFAQSVLQFFTRTESKSFELRPSQIVPVETAQADATAVPPSPSINVAEAEAQAGFDALELPSVPEGFNYLGARLYGDVINIEYEAQGAGGNLIISQSQNGYNQSSWDQVPADAIRQVKIGKLDGEFVQGTFVVYPNETSATWNPNAPILKLRWVDNGIWFEIAKFGDVERIEYLDQEGLIELAESLQ
ncbi:MAG TPA: hypothetical protein VJ972_10975 [Anaerolineales bacterium]|nr:hypothetical protein [Anaerolineales bacterium]